MNRWRQKTGQSKAKSGAHLVHLQVVVGGPHLGLQGVLGVCRVVFQTATLLQMSLELLSAPPAWKEREDVGVHFRRRAPGTGCITWLVCRFFLFQGVNVSDYEINRYVLHLPRLHPLDSNLPQFHFLHLLQKIAISSWNLCIIFLWMNLNIITVC